MNQHEVTESIIDSKFLSDVLVGLTRPQKQLHCKYFYDLTGSQLFEQICELPEYYLTRTELQIMNDHVNEMATQIGEQVMLVEFGSGNSSKTRLLLDALVDPVAYVPLDISEEHLLETANQLTAAYPEIEILPLVADFTRPFELPTSKRKPSHAAVFFPGSTIGNFLPDAAAKMLQTIARILGQDGGLLIGIDLQKEPSLIEAAYNDDQGITAEFNLNILDRINRELSADFDLDQFHHQANYNPEFGRIEIYLVSERDQSVKIGDQVIQFESGERILTEYSHKYTIDGFAAVAGQASFALHKYWTDEQQKFAVLHLVNESK